MTASKYAELITNPNFERHASPIVSSLYMLSTLEYWRRAWVQQEQYVSKNVNFHWGKRSFSRDILILFFSVMQRIQMTDVTPESRQSLVFSCENNFTLSLLPMCHFIIRTTSRQTMLDLMMNMSADSVHATNTRDLVYAFLGMASDATELAIKVDYRKDWRQVFTGFAIALFNKEGPKVFDLCCVSESKVVDPELPSWVPDLNVSDRFALNQVNTQWRFCASGDSKAVFGFIPGSELFPDLSISGILVDTLLATSTVNFISEQSIPDRLAKLEELSLNCGDKYKSLQYRDSAVWRVSVVDHIVDPKSNVVLKTFEYIRAPSNEAIEKIYNYIRAGGDLQMKVDNEEAHRDADVDYKLVSAYVGVLDIMTERKYFVSASGYLGMGPSGATSGDFIVLMFGCKMPYILRPIGGKYRFIGDAYVHGIMDGELIDQPYTAQLFTIF